MPTLRPPRTPATLGILAFCLLSAWPAPAEAYIGPGAGFALLSSFFVAFVTILAVIGSLLIWPFRTLWRLVRYGRRTAAQIDRLVVVGLDGQDPALTDRLMAAGRLPHFAALARQGSYRRIQTTYPPVSPVAWSTFATGVTPAKHNIFDFLDRDRRTYLPRLSSTAIDSTTRVLRIGRYRIPLGAPSIRLLRKSKPFWTILGEHRIWSTVLRVPITFPPDRFYGAELSAMAVPDLLGTQGTFLLFTTRPSGERFKEGGIRVPLVVSGSRAEATIHGPENTFLDGNPPLALPLAIVADADGAGATVTIGAARVHLAIGELSGWVSLTFKAVPGVTVAGLTRLQLLELGEHTSLYVAPLNIDPERPAMPVSHPGYYANYLAKKIGPFATLGLAEDTWALNERVISDGTFLKMTWDIDGERERMFFAALETLRKGALVCVFDATDRVQHMFWRYLEPGHPADVPGGDSEHRGAIDTLYERNDALVGRVMAQMGPRDLLMVLSDHGFTSFRRGVNVNAWLLAHGYLALKPGTDGRTEWLRDVDWSRTRAYCLGLSGLFLNIRGREAEGVVEPGDEAATLRTEIAAKLKGLRDADKGAVGIVEAFDTRTLYAGPYLENAPDLIIGYNVGYRVSWDCATGVVAGPVFEDNVKAWSGDHCIDPRLVPGVFFCNRAVETEAPGLVDIAPTVLSLFGVPPPKHMDGRVLAIGTQKQASAPPRAHEAGPAAKKPAARKKRRAS